MSKLILYKPQSVLDFKNTISFLKLQGLTDRVEDESNIIENGLPNYLYFFAINLNAKDFWTCDSDTYTSIFNMLGGKENTLRQYDVPNNIIELKRLILGVNFINYNEPKKLVYE